MVVRDFLEHELIDCSLFVKCFSYSIIHAYVLNTTNFDTYVCSSLVVMATADTLRATTREKVRRVIFATYRNLIQKPSSGIAEHFAIQMVTYKVLLVSTHVIVT